MIIITINVKSILEWDFCGIQKQAYFCEKNCSTATLTHCKDRRVLRNLFSTNQGNGIELIFVTGATKINLKDL